MGNKLRKQLWVSVCLGIFLGLSLYLAMGQVQANHHASFVSKRGDDFHAHDKESFFNETDDEDAGQIYDKSAADERVEAIAAERPKKKDFVQTQDEAEAFPHGEIEGEVPVSIAVPTENTLEELPTEKAPVLDVPAVNVAALDPLDTQPELGAPANSFAPSLMAGSGCVLSGTAPVDNGFWLTFTLPLLTWITRFRPRGGSKTS